MQFHPKSRALPIHLALTMIVCVPVLGRAELVEYTAGHADIGVAYEGGQLELHYHFGDGVTLLDHFTGQPFVTSENEFAPSDVVVRVADSVKSTHESVPPGFEFTGVRPGGNLWILPTADVPGVARPGIATNELKPGDWSTPITWTMTDMSGPGEFSLWRSGGITPNVQFSTADPSVINEFDFQIGGHDHFFWGFTEPGVYDIELTVTGTHVNDGVRTDTGTFRFLVGDATAVPEPGALALLGLGTLGLMGGIYSSRRKKRQHQSS